LTRSVSLPTVSPPASSLSSHARRPSPGQLCTDSQQPNAEPERFVAAPGSTSTEQSTFGAACSALLPSLIFTRKVSAKLPPKQCSAAPPPAPRPWPPSSLPCLTSYPSCLSPFPPLRRNSSLRSRGKDLESSARRRTRRGFVVGAFSHRAKSTADPDLTVPDSIAHTEFNTIPAW
jgi:hypothetical protein